MRIFTSYFANICKIPSDMVLVSISRFSPKWLEGEFKTCLSLAPPEQLVYKCKHGEHPGVEGYYKEYYNSVLNNLIPEELESYLLDLSKGHDVVLLCYEVPGQLCHRHYVAEWLELTLGYDVQELVVK